MLEKAQICRVRQSYSFNDWSAYQEEPNCTLEMLRDSRQNGSDSVAWLSHLLKEFDRCSKERTAMQLKTLVQCMLLPVVFDQLSDPKLHWLEEIVRRVEVYVSGGGGKPNWDSVRRFVSVHSSSNIVPLSMKSPCSQEGKGGS